MSYLGRGSNLTRKAQDKVSFLATAGQTVRTGLSYVPTHVDVTVNGITLTEITDYTATNGNSITFTVALALNDEVTIVSSKTFDVANHYTISAANALLAAKATNTAVALKAPFASPSFTGTVSIDSPNQASGGSALKIRQGNATSFGIDMGLSQVTGHLNISRVNSNNATHMMTLARDTGNVGVGTASPAKPLDVTGDIRTSGNLVIGTNGKGIDFSANADTSATGASTTSELLDDYEEGTWTPVLNSINSSAPAGSFAHVGSYIKVGRAVHLTIYIQCNSISSFGGGTLSIDGIPFNATTADGYMPSGIPIVHSWDPARSPHGGFTFYTNNRLGFLTSNHDSGWNWEQTNALNATTIFRCTLTYTAVS